MSTAAASRVDELMQQCSDALTQMRYHEAERIAMKAIGIAREHGDFERLARIVMPLQETRRQIYQAAQDLAEREGIQLITESVHEETEPAAGCFLVCAPNAVGADARRFRLLTVDHDMPAAIICHEPKTDMGLIPVVAISPGLSVRCKVRPPKDLTKPSLDWFMDTMEDIGDAALESVDASADPSRRVDHILMRLEAIPMHEDLHHALVAACEDAAAKD